MTVDDCYKLVLKCQKVHDRFAVGLQFVKNPRNKKLMLYTFAQDSIKLWNVVSSEDDFEIFEEKKITGNFCGIQSFDVGADGQLISVVGVESTLHRIVLDSNFEPTITEYNLGLMEIWFSRIAPDQSQIFTTSFSGSLKLLDNEGNCVRTSPFEKVKLISAVSYSNSGDYIAIGNSQGWISIVEGETLLLLYSIEAHACKIRCLQFNGDDKQLLSGSDDKIVKLYTLSESKGTLARNFCGHRGSVMQVCIDKSSGGERFASIGLDNYLILWNLVSGEKLHIFQNDSTDFFRSLTFSPNGRFIATATDDSNIITYRIPQSENYVPDEEDIIETIDQYDVNNEYEPNSPIMAEENEHSLHNEHSPLNEHSNHSPQNEHTEEHNTIEEQNSYEDNLLTKIEHLPEFNDLLSDENGSPTNVENGQNDENGSPTSVENGQNDENGSPASVENGQSDHSGPHSPDLVANSDESAAINISDTEDNLNQDEEQLVSTDDVENNDNDESMDTSDAQHPVNYQEEFERRELEMQLGID